jgi:hypothetical protein
MLKADDGTPLLPSDPACHVTCAKAHANRKKPAAATIFSLIAGLRPESGNYHTSRIMVTILSSICS